MATPVGYVLSEKDMSILKRIIKTFDRMQHYSNAFGREPEDKLDHEEFHTSECYIARTPGGGIPALMSLGSTGIGDTPGSAECTLFKKGRSGTTTDVLFSTLTKTVYNLSEFAIPENTWVVVVRDKHGSWYAVQAGQPDTSGGGGATISGPGWIAGISNEDCIQAQILAKTGKCLNVPFQTVTLTSSTGVTWTSTDDVVYSGGSGPMVLTRPCSESMPKLTIAGFCGIFEAAGVTTPDNACYADFKFGTSLCGDGPGTGSGTGGARGACCQNTFTVRLTCTPCTVTTECSDEDLDFPITYRIEWFQQTTGFTVFLGAFNINYSSTLSTPPTVLVWDGHGVTNTQNLSPFCNCGPKDIRFQLRITTGEVCTIEFRVSCNNGTNWSGWSTVSDSLQSYVGDDAIHELATPPRTDGQVEMFEDPGMTISTNPGCENCCAISFIIGHVS